MKLPWAAVLFLMAAFSAQAAEELTQPKGGKESYRLFATVESYRWKEYIEGDEILEESGPLFGIGGEFRKPISKTLEAEGLARIFFGQVDYDGAIQSSDDGSVTPYSTESSYGGVEAEAVIARPYPTRSGLVWKPLAGVGLRWWNRSLDTALGESVGTYGYEEYWTTLYAVIGLEAERNDIFGRIALHAPLYNNQSVDLSNGGGPNDIDLEPGKELSIAGELGMNFKKYFAAIYFETLEFSKSDTDTDIGLFFQPESKARIIGLRGGWNF